MPIIIVDESSLLDPISMLKTEVKMNFQFLELRCLEEVGRGQDGSSRCVGERPDLYM